ncbi:MAG: glycosyltransferase family 1 protein [Methylocystis sp.]|nr:glycosyltransferase family 1 protein [Methylocystis sp.]
MLSLIKGDSRRFIHANRPEVYNGVECYLWRTIVHPFNPKNLPISPALTLPLYWIYARLRNEFIDKAIRSAAIIIVESGLGAILLPRARALNGSAKLIYYASDNLETIGAHPIVQRSLEQCGPIVDHVCIPSRKMAARFHWAGAHVYFVPHGVNPADFVQVRESPYAKPLNAVSAGSALFDPDFFLHAAPAFPDVEFHVIGSGTTMNYSPNVRVYGEMAFKETLPFLANATFGIAPYRMAAGADTVCDTSMKLMQYDYLGIPAVCPNFVVGNSPNRFGYIPGNRASIEAAINAALAARGHIKPHGRFLSWDDVASRVLDPELFPDTRLSSLS